MDRAADIAQAVDTLAGRVCALQDGARLPRVVVLEGPPAVSERVLADLRGRLEVELSAADGRGFGWWRSAGCASARPAAAQPANPVAAQLTDPVAAQLAHPVAEQLADQVAPLARAVRAARAADEGADAPASADELTAPVAGVLRRWGVPGFPAPTPDDVLTVAGTDLGGDHRTAGAALAQVIQALSHRNVPAIVVLDAEEDGRDLLAALDERRDLPILAVVLADPAGDAAWRRHVAAGTAQLLTVCGDTADAVPPADPAASAAPPATTATTATTAATAPTRWIPKAQQPPKSPHTLETARSLAAQYRHDEALALAERLLAADGPGRLGDEDRLTLHHERASWIGASGRARAAADAFRTLTEEFTADLGATHQRTLAARLALTTWLGTSGDLRGALAVSDPLIEDLRALPDHVAGLEARALHLTWSTRVGAASDALTLTPDLAADQARVLGPASPAAVRTRDLHARQLADAGHPAAALAAYERLARDRVRALGPDAPAVLAIRSNIAFLLGTEAGPQEAIAAYSTLLADQTRVLGPDHAATRLTKENLGAWLRSGSMGGTPSDAPGTAAGRPPRRPGPPPPGDSAAQDDAALDRLTALVDERAGQFGADHPGTLTVRAELAAWLGAARRAEHALAAYTDLLADQERVLGPAHPEAVRSRRNLTFLAERAGRYAHAAELQRRAVAVGQAEHEADHPDVLQARHDLAYLLGLTGDHEQAVSGMQAALDDQLRLLGATDPQVHATRNNLANLLGRAGRHDEAARACLDLAGDLARWIGPEHPRTLASLASAAHWTARAGREAEAIERYDDVLPRLEAAIGAEHPDVVRVRGRRAELQAGA